MTHNRAWILLPSGRRLDLLAPDPSAWTDRDLAIGLSRTYRWAGYSAWDLPLSVAQHSLTVLAICKRLPGPPLTGADGLREVLHDGTEALMGGWDPITPLKPHLGPGFERLVARLQAAIDARYDLQPWNQDSFRRHKQADRLAAASEACHVTGWSREALREQLGIEQAPLTTDPLDRLGGMPTGMRPWEPWPPRVAEEKFLAQLNSLSLARRTRSLISPPMPSLGYEDQVIEAGVS